MLFVGFANFSHQNRVVWRLQWLIAELVMLYVEYRCLYNDVYRMGLSFVNLVKKSRVGLMAKSFYSYLFSYRKHSIHTFTNAEVWWTAKRFQYYSCVHFRLISYTNVSGMVVQNQKSPLQRLSYLWHSLVTLHMNLGLKEAVMLKLLGMYWSESEESIYWFRYLPGFQTLVLYYINNIKGGRRSTW